METRLRTLTPLWTGGVDGTCDRVHETGIIGSLREASTLATRLALRMASKPPPSKLGGITSGMIVLGACRPQTPARHSSPQQAGGHPGHISEETWPVTRRDEKAVLELLDSPEYREEQEYRDRLDAVYEETRQQCK